MGKKTKFTAEMTHLHLRSGWSWGGGPVGLPQRSFMCRGMLNGTPTRTEGLTVPRVKLSALPSEADKRGRVICLRDSERMINTINTVSSGVPLTFDGKLEYVARKLLTMEGCFAITC